jgi:predicted kinase
MERTAMNRVVCLSGCSGSGKSTYARNLLAACATTASSCSTIVSADDFFTLAGVYRFDASKLGLAHASCFRRFMMCMLANDALVVVDNTNTSPMEIAPYALAAAAFKYGFELVTIECDVEMAAARNTHGVPADKVRQQAERISKRQLPRYWKQSVVRSISAPHKWDRQCCGNARAH